MKPALIDNTTQMQSGTLSSLKANCIRFVTISSGFQAQEARGMC